MPRFSKERTITAQWRLSNGTIVPLNPSNSKKELLMKHPLPSLPLLHSLLRYDPSTGLLWWKVCPSIAMKKRWFIVSAGGLHPNGYLYVRIHKRSFSSHRVAWALHYGEWPNSTIDHINGIRTDNRIQNLRLATYSQQMFNSRIPRNNTSGTKGVHFDKHEQKWRVTIKANGKSYRRYFLIKEDAIAYVATSREQLHGEFARHQ